MSNCNNNWPYSNSSGQDLFNNSANNYSNPGLSPCAGTGNDKYLEFVEDGIGIVQGANIIAKIDFSGLKIPVASWTQQQIVLQPGEVTFIQGLTKGIRQRQQGYDWPTLISSNTALNPYFMQVDLSINYYNQFSYLSQAVDGSGNYTQNLSVADALNLSFNGKQIKVTSTYDPSTLFFTGNQAGYDYDVTAAQLTLIDASLDANSPFPPFIIDGERVPQIYTLVEDPSKSVSYAKYPNSASQGVILKSMYPPANDGVEVCKYSKWIYLAHATDDVVVCEPIELNFNSEVSTNLTIVYDGSTYLGDKPTFIVDPSADGQFYDGSINLPDGITYDLSVNVYDQIIDNSTLTNLNIYDSSITNSTINTVNMYGGYVDNTSADYFYAVGIESSANLILDTQYYIVNSVLRSPRLDSPIGPTYAAILEDTIVYDASATVNIYVSGTSEIYGCNFYSNIGSVRAKGDPSANTWPILDGFSDQSSYGGTYYGSYVYVEHARFQNSTFTKTAAYPQGDDSSIYNVRTHTSESLRPYGGLYYRTSILEKCYGNMWLTSDIVNDSSIFTLRSMDSSIYNSSILTTRGINSDPNGIGFVDETYFENCTFNNDPAYPATLYPLAIQESSIYSSAVNTIEIGNSLISNSDVSVSSIGESTVLEQSIVYDSSLDFAIINNGSTINNSIIKDSYANVFVLLVDPSTGEKMYVMEDDTLPLDSSAWNVTINESTIWDSSLNNVTVYDSSIYRGYIQDSSLIGCTLYNVETDGSMYIDSRTIMVDASITAAFDIIDDTSTFYQKVTKRLDVGMSGNSTSTIMSSGDYLNWINENKLWKKVGDMYAWTSAPDSTECPLCDNLVDGFYLFNPQTFPVAIEYMVFI